MGDDMHHKIWKVHHEAPVTDSDSHLELVQADTHFLSTHQAQNSPLKWDRMGITYITHPQISQMLGEWQPGFSNVFHITIHHWHQLLQFHINEEPGESKPYCTYSTFIGKLVVTSQKQKRIENPHVFWLNSPVFAVLLVTNPCFCRQKSHVLRRIDERFVPVPLAPPRTVANSPPGIKTTWCTQPETSSGDGLPLGLRPYNTTKWTSRFLYNLYQFIQK